MGCQGCHIFYVINDKIVVANAKWFMACAGKFCAFFVRRYNVVQVDGQTSAIETKPSKVNHQAAEKVTILLSVE